ncbi:hypothetical protein ACFVSW_01045 [Neobacillus sp. NPDC058068]|uniref:hypothetical protein n=1 Tax=Neobacillus sp. NPDC058068 TaxID=3346325 RepID=UPI0036DBDF96
MTVTAQFPWINLLKVDKLSPVTINTKIRFDLDANGDKLQFAWYIFRNGKRIEYIPYQEANVLEWEPNEPGSYYIKAFTRDKDGEQVSIKSAEYKVIDCLKFEDIEHITPNLQSPQHVGAVIKWEANVIGEELKYAWYVYKDNKRVDYISFSKSNQLEWSPPEKGTYTIKLFVKDLSGNKFSKWSNDYIIQ